MAINLDEINTLTTKKIYPGVIDNFFKGGPIMAYLRKDRLKNWDGGPQIQENFLFRPLKGGFYAKGADFDLTKYQTFTGLLFEPRFAQVSVVEYLEDLDTIIKGPTAVMNRVQVDLSNAAMTLSAILEIAILKHGQNVGGDDRTLALNGISEALNDGINASWQGLTFPTYGGQSRTDMEGALTPPTGLIAANVNGPISYRVLEHSYQSCKIGSEVPKLGITTQRCMGYINENFHPMLRLQDTRDPVIGWTGVKFQDATVLTSNYFPGADGVNDPLIGSYNAATESFLWLNPGGGGDDAYFRLHLATAPRRRFGFSGFKVAQGNEKVAGQIFFAGNFTFRAIRLSRWLHGING